MALGIGGLRGTLQGRWCLKGSLDHLFRDSFWCNGAAVIVEKLVKILSRRASQGAAVEFAALLGRFALMHDHRRWRVLLAFAPTSPRVVGPESLAASPIDCYDGV